MKKYIVTGLVLSMCAGAAAQAEISQGMITTIAPHQTGFTLKSGEMFAIDGQRAKDALAGFKVGDQVTVDWARQGGHMVAKAISGEGTDVTSGVISSIDRSAGTVTLSDGTRFQVGGDAKAALSGFKVGDQINVAHAGEASASGVIPGRAISASYDKKVVGTVKSIDQTNGKLILDNGMVFSVPGGDQGRTVLKGLLPGDSVNVTWTGSGSAMVTVSISPA